MIPRPLFHYLKPYTKDYGNQSLKKILKQSECITLYWNLQNSVIENIMFPNFPLSILLTYTIFCEKCTMHGTSSFLTKWQNITTLYVFFWLSSPKGKIDSLFLWKCLKNVKLSTHDNSQKLFAIGHLIVSRIRRWIKNTKVSSKCRFLIHSFKNNWYWDKYFGFINENYLYTNRYYDYKSINHSCFVTHDGMTFWHCEIETKIFSFRNFGKNEKHFFLVIHSTFRY